MGLFKGNRKFECNQDPQTKELICESFRQDKDGTKVPLASLRAQVDGMCNPVVSNMQEHEEGELEELEKKVRNRMVAKCNKSMATGKPAEY